jgi:hypothetical protein
MARNESSGRARRRRSGGRCWLDQELTHRNGDGPAYSVSAVGAADPALLMNVKPHGHPGVPCKPFLQVHREQGRGARDAHRAERARLERVRTDLVDSEVPVLQEPPQRRSRHFVDGCNEQLPPCSQGKPRTIPDPKVSLDRGFHSCGWSIEPHGCVLVRRWWEGSAPIPQPSFLRTGRRFRPPSSCRCHHSVNGPYGPTCALSDLRLKRCRTASQPSSRPQTAAVQVLEPEREDQLAVLVVEPVDDAASGDRCLKFVL